MSMYRPSLKSGRSLFILLILAIILFLIAHNSHVRIKATNYDEKVEAATLMKTFMDTLKVELEERKYDFDPIDDPFHTGLIGLRLSSITTDRGLLSDKQAALNPNLAAIFIEEFKNERLQAGDHIAVAVTGSTPSVNLALYAAIKVLDLKPSIITAVSSASYGANREDFTWLDIEAILKEKGLIDFGSSYASFGGKEDLAIGLSDNGIANIRDAMARNNVPLLMGSNLEENVALRDAAYKELLPKGKRYKMFVNIGAALANVGSEPNARLIPEGLNKRLAEKSFEREGVMMLMARQNVPVLHVRRIQRWAKKYDVASHRDEIPTPGEGPAFSRSRHNIVVASICLAILVAAIIVVIVFDRHDRRFMANIVDPDEEL
ncbi:MAG TPA: poly-gamma-glutamate system protein [Candidatus Cloacimonetes bacterium]|nr:poly-gamma-glutamate system protein [Candidatus Cloacimonadota bacterium]